MTPEEKRDDLLKRITAILTDTSTAYVAPELRTPEGQLARTRSALYQMMCDEFNEHARAHGDVTARALAIFGLKGTTPSHVLLDYIEQAAKALQAAKVLQRI